MYSRRSEAPGGILGAQKNKIRKPFYDVQVFPLVSLIFPALISMPAPGLGPRGHLVKLYCFCCCSCIEDIQSELYNLLTINPGYSNAFKECNPQKAYTTSCIVVKELKHIHATLEERDTSEEETWVLVMHSGWQVWKANWPLLLSFTSMTHRRLPINKNTTANHLLEIVSTWCSFQHLHLLLIPNLKEMVSKIKPLSFIYTRIKVICLLNSGILV